LEIRSAHAHAVLEEEGGAGDGEAVEALATPREFRLEGFLSLFLACFFALANGLKGNGRRWRDGLDGVIGGVFVCIRSKNIPGKGSLAFELRNQVPLLFIVFEDEAAAERALPRHMLVFEHVCNTVRGMLSADARAASRLALPACLAATLALGLLVLGPGLPALLMLQAGLSLITLKLLILLALLFIASPTATHAIARVAMLRGLKPILHDKDSH
jgi:hypothetical protein